MNGSVTGKLPGAGFPTPRAQQWATRVALFLVGYGFAVWAAFIPFVKMHTGLDEGGLGLLLLSLGIGAVGTMPFTGSLVSRFSCRAVALVSGLSFCVILPLLGWLSNIPALVGCIFMVGAGMGALEVAANIQAVHVQREAGRAMMSGFHAFYSVGSIAGAGFVTFCLSNGLSTLFTGLLGILPVLAALVVLARGLLGPQKRTTGRKNRFFARPKGVVTVLGLLLMSVYITEASVSNWGALLLAGFKGFQPEQAALGFTCFSVTVVLGRLVGDKLIGLIGGSARMFVAAGLSSALVYLAVIQLLPGNWSLVGFALLGLTVSPLAPCLYNLTAKQQVMPEESAVSAVTAFGYGSALFSSPLIGLIARHTSLPASLSCLSALLTVMALCMLLLCRKVPVFAPKRAGRGRGN